MGLVLPDRGGIERLAFEHERELQAVLTARMVEDLVDRRMHVVLAGDFDTTPDAGSIRFWRGLQSLDGMSVSYRDVWADAHPTEPGHTFTPDDPMVSQGNWPLERGRRIDYIWASDHFGVLADLAVLAAS